MLSGCSLISSGSQAAPELLKPVKTAVDVIPVAKGSISDKIDGMATVVPKQITYAEYKIDGSISKVDVKAGDRVKAGDVLVELDPGTLALDILNQQVTLEKAKIAMTQAKDSGNEDQIRVASMSVAVEQQQLDDYVSRQNSLQLLAPVSGVVSFVDPTLAPNVNITAYRDLVGIVDPTDVDLQFTLPANSNTTLNEVQLGMPVSLTYNGTTVTGKVTQIPNTAPPTDNPIQSDRNQRTLLFNFDKKPSGIALGDNVSFSLVLQHKEDVIVIPRVALRSYQGRDFVDIMDGTQRKDVDVQKGIVSATQVEITKGLKEGMKLILNN